MRPLRGAIVAIKVAQIIFVIAFVGSLSVGACIAGFVFVNYVLSPIVRLVFPSFGVYENPDLLLKETKVDKKEVHLTAIDFIIQEKLRRQTETKKQLQELMNFGKPHSVIVQAEPTPAITKEWDLEAMQAAATQGLFIHGVSQPISKDLWSIARFNGSDRPRYLCFKLSQRGRGLRTAFAALPDRACRMDRAAAFRWAAVLGIECEVVPMNAASRQVLR